MRPNILSHIYKILIRNMILEFIFIVLPYGLHVLLGEIRPCICLFCGFGSSQMALLSNMNFYSDYKTRLCLIVPGRQEKIYFCTRKFLSTRYT